MQIKKGKDKLEELKTKTIELNVQPPSTTNSKA